MANSLAQYLADLQVQIKESETQLVFGEVISTSPLRVKYGEITLEDNFLFVEDGLTLTVGQEVPMLKTNRSQLFIVMLSNEMTPQDILSAIKTVDGSGSGLDADLLDGKHASDFSLDGHTQDWTTITGKPTTFAPSVHNQSWTTITDTPTTATRWPTWSEVTSKPSTFAPSSHTHNYLSDSYLSGRTISNANSADGAGVTAYYLPSSASNKPTGTDHSLLTLSYGDTWSTQLASDWRTNEWYVRNQSNGSWGAWRTLYHTGNIPTQATRWPTWSEVTSKPSTFTPSSHSHTGTTTTGAWTTHQTAYGTISLGPANSGYNHINSSLNAPFYMYYDLQVAGGKPVWHSGNSYGSNATNGYIRFQNGLKLNWVQVTIPASTRGKTFNWPSAFTSAVYATWASSKYYDMQGGVDGATKTGGTVNAGACSNGGTVGVAITWTAYGIGV